MPKHYHIAAGSRMRLPPGTRLAKRQRDDDGFPVFLYVNDANDYSWVMTQEDDGSWRAIEYGPGEECDCE